MSVWLRRRVVSASLLAGAMIIPLVATSQERLPAFRKEYVPIDALPGHIHGLLPMPRAQFEQILRRAAATQANAPPGGRAYVSEVVLKARYASGNLVEGSGEFSVELEGETPQLLAIDPWNLTLEKARWEGDGQLAIGRYRDGKLYCLVERTGKLLVQWQHAAERTAGEDASFQLRLPPALHRSIELDLPKDVEVNVDAGAVTYSQTAQSAAQRKCLVRLAATDLARLVFHDGQQSARELPLVVVQESSTYALVPTAIDIHTAFTVDILDQPLTELKLISDRPLSLASVRWHDQELTWQETSAEASPDRWTAVCRLPVPLAGVQQAIEVEATTPFDPKRGAKLPRIAIAGAVLQQAQLTAKAPSWMRLSAHAIGESQLASPQNATANGATASAQDQFAFVVYGPSGQVEVAVDPAPTSLSVRSVTHITVEPSQVAGQFHGELTTSAGNLFEVEAQVPRQWVVDAVETNPPDMLIERFLNARGSGPQQLLLKLARPVTRDRPLSLTIRAHYRRPTNLQLTRASGLSLVVFPRAEQKVRLVNLRVSDPQAELSLEGDGQLGRLAPESLASADQRLLAEEPAGLLFDFHTAGEEFRARLRPAVARYRGEIRLENRVDQREVQQTLSLLCTPEGTSLGSIAVRLSPPPQGRVRWQLAGDDQRELSATVEPGGPGEEVHRILLPRPMNLPVAIRGSWSQGQGEPLTFVGLPEANQQTAVVELYADRPLAAAQARGMRSLPLPPAADRERELVSRYSYEPGDRPSLVVSFRPGGAGVAQAWIESLEMTTYFAAGGTIENLATFVIKAAGPESVHLHLPESIVDIRQIEPKGEKIIRRGPGGSFEVPFVVQEGAGISTIRYVVGEQAFAGWPISQLTVPWPQTNLPVLRRNWKVAMPPSFAACEPGGSRSEGGEPSPFEVLAAWPASWREFFAGPAFASKWLSFAVAGEPSTSEFEFRGWRLFEMSLTAGQAATLRVFKPAEFVAWSLGVLLLVTIAASSLRNATTWLLTASGVGLAASALVPAPWSWIVMACGLGLAAGGGLALLGCPLLGIGRRTSGSAISAAAAAMGAVLLVSLAAGRPARAEPEAADASRPRAVLAIDEEGQVTGEYVYLEPQLYDALQKLASPDNAAAPKWLIGEASYHIAASGSNRQSLARTVEAAWEIWTSQDDVALDFALVREQVSLVPRAARLDGEPIALSWSPEGHGLVVPVRRAGKHKLELTLAVAASVEDRVAEIDLRLPAAAMSSVRVPAGVEHANRHASTERLLLRWPLSEEPISGPGPVVVEQHNAWRIRPASVVLETQFQLHGTQVFDQITLQVDPRLRRVQSLQSGAIERIDENSATNQLTIYFSEPAEEFSFRLAWLWPGATGLGKLILPRVSVLDAETREDLAGLIVDPELRLTTAAPAENAELRQRFMQHWSDSAATLGTVFDLRKMKPRPMVDVAAASERPTANIAIDWSVASTYVRAAVSLELSNVPAKRYEHHFELPAALRVREAVVRQADRTAAVRWRQSASGALTITFLEPPQPEQVIRFEADLATNRDRAEIELPSIRSANVEPTSVRLRLFRQPDVQLSVQSGPPLPATGSDALDALGPQRGRLAAQWKLDGTSLANPSSGGASSGGPSFSTAITVSRLRNRPGLSGKIQIRAAQADGDWRCEVAGDVTAASGIVDQLRLLVPASWSDELQIDPPMEYTFEPANTREERLLRLFPSKPVSGSFSFRISGPLEFSTGGIQVPNVQLLDAKPLEREVLLDAGPTTQPLDWEISGLAPLQRPGRAPAARNAAPGAYRVTGRQFRAVARYRQDQTKTSALILRDLRTDLETERAVTTAIMLIEPASPNPIVFHLPPGSRLLQALADSRAAACERIGIRSWQVAPASNFLPFELTLIYESRQSANEGSGALALVAPELAGLSPAPALWTVHPNGDQAVQVSGGTVAAASRSESQLTRLEAYARALEAVRTATASAAPKPVLAEAFARWGGLAASADEQLMSVAGDQSRTPEQLARRRAALESISLARQRLLQAEILTEESDIPAATTKELGADEVVFLVSGNELVLEGVLPSRARKGASATRWLLAPALLAATLVLFRTAAPRRLADWLLARRYFALAALGLIWWLLAPAGWLGWFALAAAGWLAAGNQAQALIRRRTSSAT